LWALLLGRDGVHSTDKKFTIVRLDCEIRSMLRRRRGVVMGEEYVQEHILTGGIVEPVEGASPTHSSPLTAISLSVVASYPTHLRRKSRRGWLRVKLVAPTLQLGGLFYWRLFGLCQRSKPCSAAKRQNEAAS